MKITLTQINPTLGSFKDNFEKICAEFAIAYGTDLQIFPEMALTGYPLEDLARNAEFQKSVEEFNTKIVEFSPDHVIAFGTIFIEDDKLYNGAIIAKSGEIIAKIKKQELPNYGVFDEKRVFDKGLISEPIEINGARVGFLICEDAWIEENSKLLKEKGAEVIAVLNASPFEQNKLLSRISLVKKIASDTSTKVVYVNLVGGQDSLVFDGNSFAINKHGNFLVSPLGWNARTKTIDLAEEASGEYLYNLEKEIYNALILGLRDYVQKSGFKSVLLGLSGGIDSALVAVIAADALGSENVLGVRLPSKYSSNHSLEDAKILAENLNMDLKTIEIEKINQGFLDLLAPEFKGLDSDITEENLQSRIRGVILMALSNKLKKLLITTGNKSEYATGYATLYGDMNGAFGVIKDLYKTEVYRLAKWRNENIPDLSICPVQNPIPLSSIIKPPSAELRPDQTDQDSLPEYDVLDPILYGLIEEDNPKAELYKQHPKELVDKIYHLVKISEFKRRQSAIGPKISKRDFTKDRRYPIVNKF